jgi:hypothetical protein
MTTDTIFCFEDELRREGWVRIRVWEKEGKSIVIVTDQDKGPSVTNAAEVIATQVVQAFGIDPERLIWVEHYPPIKQKGGTSWEEEYDFVSLMWDGERFTSPDWRYSSQLEVEQLLGEKL